jgi:hypothetical protein
VEVERCAVLARFETLMQGRVFIGRVAIQGEPNLFFLVACWRLTPPNKKRVRIYCGTPVP